MNTKIKKQTQSLHLEKLRQRVRDARSGSQRKKLVSQFLRSHDARLQAILDAYEALDPEFRPEKATLPSLAESLDPWKPCKEPVFLHLRPKNSSPGHRTVLEFGIAQRARQYHVRRVLGELLQLHSDQYLFGGGVHEAVEQTAKALQDGCQWVVEIDIINCYPSFDGKKLTKLLPLPKEVTEYVILSEHLNIVPRKITRVIDPGNVDGGNQQAAKNALLAARRGIPQGSSASSIVSEAMIAIALEQIPSQGVIIAFADNILLLAKTQADLCSMTKACEGALEAHPVGRLRSRSTVFKKGQSIQFLGHKFDVSMDGVAISPALEHLAKFKERVSTDTDFLRKTKKRAVRCRRYQELKSFINGWAAAFSLCDDVRKFKKEALSEADEAFDRHDYHYIPIRLKSDQFEIVRAALDDIREEVGTEHDSVALEYLAIEHMGSGISFPDLRSAVKAAWNKASSTTAFTKELAAVANDVLSEGEVNISFSLKGGSPKVGP